MMAPVDAAVLAERTASVQRHLRRVAERLPSEVGALRPATDATDAVILHLWQAVQVVLDVAVSSCVTLGLGSPATYGDAFRLLAAHGVIEPALSERLVRAAGFRNVLVHAYADLDLARVHAAAVEGPDDLIAVLAAIRDRLAGN
jgi:uncharacterized protein YutE (UPF0331/DUF86 family)